MTVFRFPPDVKAAARRAYIDHCNSEQATVDDLGEALTAALTAAFEQLGMREEWRMTLDDFPQAPGAVFDSEIEAREYQASWTTADSTLHRRSHSDWRPVEDKEGER